MISPTSAGLRRSPYTLSWVVFCEEFEYEGLMTAVGCRKSAIFDRGSNLCLSRDKKMKKKCPRRGSNHQKPHKRRDSYHQTNRITYSMPVPTQSQHRCSSINAVEKLYLKFSAKIQKLAISFNCLVKIYFLDKFGGLHNKYNDPIRPKYSHIQVTLQGLF